MKYLKQWKQDGNWRIRLRRHGFKEVELRPPPGYRGDKATLAKPGEKHATYGTVAWLVGEYFASLDFLGRPASMKVKHRRYIEDFRAGAAISRWRGSRPGIWRSCLPR